MTAKDGKPCKKCGTSDWYKRRDCKECQRRYDQKWWENHRDKKSEYNAKWRKENQDRMNELGRIWRKANPEKAAAISNIRRTKITAAGGSYTADEFKALCNHYGNKCLRCGRENVKLTADHVLPVARGGSSDISNIQPLCKSCNSAKNARHIDYRPDAGPLRWLQAKLFG